MALVVVEEAFHVLNAPAALLVSLARRINEWVGLSQAILSGVLIYSAIASLGLAVLVLSHHYGNARERQVVRATAFFLLVGGFFGGPVSAFARSRFIEE